MNQNNISKIIKDPFKIVPALGSRNMLKWIPDRIYLKLLFRGLMGEKLDLDNLSTFNEKLQWLKIYDRRPEYVTYVDKYAVREYIKQTIGEKYLIHLIGVYDHVGDIPWNELPDKFVLKCTHSSGCNIICNDKSKLNIKDAKKKLNKWMRHNYYYPGREWPYKNVQPRIICEELLQTMDGQLPIDYKFHCFSGEPDNVMVCLGRDTGKPKYYFFDSKWNLLRYNLSGINAPQNFTLPKPKMIDEMFNIARKLSMGLPFVRVDLYCEEEQIYFGELTFFPQSGFDSNLMHTTDVLFGDKINF